MRLDLDKIPLLCKSMRESVTGKPPKWRSDRPKKTTFTEISSYRPPFLSSLGKKRIDLCVGKCQILAVLKRFLRKCISLEVRTGGSFVHTMQIFKQRIAPATKVIEARHSGPDISEQREILFSKYPYVVRRLLVFLGQFAYVIVFGVRIQSKKPDRKEATNSRPPIIIPPAKNGRQESSSGDC